MVNELKLAHYMDVAKLVVDFQELRFKLLVFNFLDPRFLLHSLPSFILNAHEGSLSRNDALFKPTVS